MYETYSTQSMKSSMHNSWFQMSFEVVVTLPRERMDLQALIMPMPSLLSQVSPNGQLRCRSNALPPMRPVLVTTLAHAARLLSYKASSRGGERHILKYPNSIFM